MCRGADWQQSPWPIVVKGLKTVDECFETCTSRQGCTAFEMGPPSQKNKHTCLLMGHDDVQLADSLSLQDRTCYRIPGRLAIIIDAKKAKVPKVNKYLVTRTLLREIKTIYLGAYKHCGPENFKKFRPK